VPNTCFGDFFANPFRSFALIFAPTSQFAANADSPVRFLRYHAAVESAIQATQMAYTFLRPNLFMQSLLNFRSLIVEQNTFYAAIGDAKVSVVDVRDIADVAVAALTELGMKERFTISRVRKR
jgi:uncharacterized protein YbjT (DUF2867 family)